MGIIAVLIYGIMVCLSTLYPDISSMWLNAVLNVVLGTVIAAVVGVLVGFLVMPSLASDEVSPMQEVGMGVWWQTVGMQHAADRMSNLNSSLMFV